MRNLENLGYVKERNNWRLQMLKSLHIPVLVKLVIEDKEKIPIRGNPFYFDKWGYLRNVKGQERDNKAFGMLMSEKCILRNNETLIYYYLDN